MNHQKHLLKLFKTFLLACGDTDEQKKLFWHYLSGWIPAQAASKVFQDSGLRFSCGEKQLYYNSYFELRKDQRTEYLKDDELNKRLSNFAIEVIEKKDKFGNQSELTISVDKFLNEIMKPVEKYEVLFKINNMNADLKKIIFWDCTIAKPDTKELVEWGFKKGEPQVAGIDFFKDQNTLVIQETGNSHAEIVDRARKKAGRRIRALQSYLKGGYIHDFQLLFCLSEKYAIKNITTQQVSSGYQRDKSSPLNYDYPTLMIENVDKANRDYLSILSFSPKFQNLLERTLYWIGLSISEIEMDLKIAYLCTALETLLTTKR